jgi:TPR repeat protein
MPPSVPLRGIRPDIVFEMRGFVCFLLLMLSAVPTPSVRAAPDSDSSIVSSGAANKPNLDELRAKAEAGDVNAEYQLVGMYLKGDGVPQDITEAFKWSHKAAEQGISGAQYGVGLMYYNGSGVPGDKLEAAKWFRKAAEQGDARSEDWLGLMYSKGEGIDLDKSESLKWYRKAADQGDASGEYHVGLFYEFNAHPKDDAEACQWYRKAAEQGLPVAEMWYGSHLLLGYGVAKDSDVAIKWIRKAADQGQADAETWLGRFYSSGERVPIDKAEAVKWFRKAAEQGEDYSQYEMGLSYFFGDGVPKDPIEAFKWMRKAAEQGLANAERQVAFFYAQGFGVPKDQIEAFKWSRKAAEQGDVQAQILLATTYAAGDGAPTDKIEAFAWFIVAAASGDENAIKYRDQLERELGGTAKFTAQKRSDELTNEIEAIKAGHAGSVSSPSDLLPTNQTPKSYGSGAIVSAQGNILTAAHVVAGATQVVVVTLQGRRSATVLQIDEANDIAVLKIEGGPYVPLPITPSHGVRLGQAVATIGFPNVEIQGFSPKVTRGEISSIDGAADDPREWQISVPVQPGNSGGPLLDNSGNLVGIVESKLGVKAAQAIGDIPQNVSYAVKSAYALALLEPYLDSSTPESNRADQNQSFEDMVAKAQQSVVLILVY